MAVSFLRTNTIFRNLKQNILQCKRNNGYVVLIPEIGEELPGKNSLLTDEGLPEFNDITIEKCVGAIGRLSIEYETRLKQIESTADKCRDVFEDIFVPLEDVDSQLELTWGVAKTLYLGNSSVMPTKSYLGIHERAHRARASKFTSIPIYKAVTKEKGKCKQLTEEKERLLNKYALEGRLNGLDITGMSRERLNFILPELHNEKKLFREKVEVATKKFQSVIENAEFVRVFPESLLRSMAADSSDSGRGPWTVTLQPHIYDNFMQHCPDKTLRWNAWQANIRKCSGYNDRALETSTHLEKIRALRQEQAKILGFDSYADMSMETKMAGSVENVYAVLDNLLDQARPAQDEELKLLHAFAKDEGFEGSLEHCDIPYWERKQRLALLKFDDEKIREYFPLPKVVASLFNICSKLFNIEIVERPNTHTWHKDVKFFTVVDRDTEEAVAGFYLDPYTREADKVRIYGNNGWHIPIRNKSTILGNLPLSTLIFNFQVPMYGKQSLLSFNEVITLFNTFGSALRHLLTKVNYSEVSGSSNIEWDAASVAGQVLTHWLYDPVTLQDISKHYATEEPLPDDVVQNLHHLRSHMAGYNLSRELYLSTLDLELHRSKEFWRDIVRKIWPAYNALPFDKHDAHPCSFTKIFSEEWGAAYYSNIWSRMVAADVYGAFVEAKHNNEDTLAVSKRYRDTFLALGGSCHPAEVFRRFRGRDPSPKALLENLNLHKKQDQKKEELN